jgi:hypothetical protein
MQEPTLSYPFGRIDKQSVDFAAAIELDIRNQKTLVEVGTMSADCTLTANPAHDLEAGAELIVKLTSDATARAATLGTGFTGTSIAGTISKTKYAAFVYDGSKFVHLSTNQVN